MTADMRARGQPARLDVEGDLAGSRPAVSLEHVSRTYPVGQAGVTALDDVSLQVAEGEFLAVMGPSGSGKSTLLNLIGALDAPTSGHIVVGGRDIGTLSVKEAARYRRREVGFVFQSFHLLPRLTVLENVALPLMLDGVAPRERARRAEEALTRLGMAARLGHSPTALSGGEKQRAAIARALINNPRLLLADEPTGNVDSRTAEVVMDLLVALNRSRGQTVVLITHNPEVATRAHRIVHLRDGALVTKGA
jgi:ABC-type lipoprotein export system ATPase subunit